MAELADALDLGSSSERSTGSIPARCTKMLIAPLVGSFILVYGKVYDKVYKVVYDEFLLQSAKIVKIALWNCTLEYFLL